MHEFTRKPRGFVLVTGPTGSGKSTSLAAMIDEINSTREEHIMTIEDPIEFLHGHKKCIVNQRELGSDAQSFGDALKAALRQDPDVILVGEMRDLETISTALTAAETGHLVFATLHTQDTAQTIDRIIDVFPAHQQGQVRVQLSVALQGIMTQQLLPNADGSGRVVACEVLVPNPAIRNLIREGKTHQIYSVLQTSSAAGMQTMDTSLATLVRQGKITQKLAESRSGTPEELRRLLGANIAGRGLGARHEHLRLQGDRPHRRQGPRRGRGRLQAGGLRPAQAARSDRPRHRRQALLARDRARLPEARQGHRTGGLLAPALDDDHLGDEHPARAVRARGADREQVPQGNDRRGPQGRRGRPLAERLDGAPPEGLQPAVRRDDRRQARWAVCSRTR